MTAQRVVPRTPGGFPELLPADQIAFNRMLSTIRETYETFGFTPIETPAVEFNDILFAKGGGETERQIYRLDDEMSLHFDLTVPLARYAAQHINQLVLPFRRCQIQKVWRAEKRQSGRFNEFYQCDVDVLGSSDPMHDAEMPAVIWSAFNAMGYPEIRIKISNRKVLNGLLASIGVLPEGDLCQTDVLRMVDKIEKTGKDTIFAQLADMGMSQRALDALDEFLAIEGENGEILTKLAGMAMNEVFEDGLNELSQVIECIGLFGVPDGVCAIDLATARGLDYYTGTVYETTLLTIPDAGSVCSGGRFDNLVGCYSETSLPGVGISIGATRLFMKLKEKGQIGELKQAVPSRVLIAHMGGVCLERAVELATAIRQVSIPAEIYMNGDKVKLDKAFRYADRNGIPYVVVIGENEVASGEYVVKQMSDGRQVTMPVNHVATAVSGRGI